MGRFGTKYNDNVDKYGSSSLYVALTPGEAIKMILVGEERVGLAAYTEGQGFAKAEEGEDGARLRFAVAVWCEKSMKVLEGPETLYRALGELADSVDLNQQLISIKKVNNKQYQVQSIKTLADADVDKLNQKTPLDLPRFVKWLDDDGIVDAEEDKQTEIGDVDIPF